MVTADTTRPDTAAGDDSPAAAVVDVMDGLDRIDIHGEWYPVRMTATDRTRMMDRMAANLSAVVDTADPVDVAAGVGWYPLARRIIRGIARHHDDTVTVDMVTGLVAASSPRSSWPDNLRAAHRIADDPAAVRHVIPSVRSTVAAIRDGHRPLSVIRGSKSRAFHRNLSGDMAAVTVDVWMMRILAGDMDMNGRTVKALERTGAYGMAADAVRMVAHRWPWPVRPAELQAIGWHRVRSVHGIADGGRVTMTNDTTDGVRSTVAAVTGRTDGSWKDDG